MFPTAAAGVSLQNFFTSNDAFIDYLEPTPVVMLGLGAMNMMIRRKKRHVRLANKPNLEESRLLEHTLKWDRG